MHNVKLIIEYDGAPYHGWQVQPGKETVQGMLQEKLKILLHEKAILKVAGRTDSGVHASGQAANFKTNSELAPESIQKALNSLLPQAIVIREVCYAPDEFDARASALSRLYRYSILNRGFRSVFLDRFTYFYPYPLKTALIRKASGYLIGRHNFSSFCRGRHQNPVKTVMGIKVSSNREGFIYIDIESNAFLTNMVRIIAGTLLEAGRGRIAPERLKDILEAKDRKLAGPTLPAKGLCLMRVIY